MQLSLLIGMIMVASLEVTRSRFQTAYGKESKDSVEYVVLIATMLLMLFYAFPEYG
jgi:hypothetical protein